MIFPGTLVSAADLLKLRYRRRHAIEHPARCRIWFRVSRDCDYAADSLLSGSLNRIPLEVFDP